MLEMMESEILVVKNEQGFVDFGSWDKANRWLGFLQGVFWMSGTYTLDQIREHNLPASEETT
jgi:hypothetical protein